MPQDELARTALYVVPPLIIAGVTVHLIFVHPAFWVYLVAVLIVSLLLGGARRALSRRRERTP